MTLRLRRFLSRVAVGLTAAAAACTSPRFEVPPGSGLQAPALGGVVRIRYRQPLVEMDVIGDSDQELAGPVAVGDTVYVGSTAGVFYALDGGNGQARWSFDVGTAVSSVPLVHGDIVYFGADDGALYALDRKTGNQLWSYKGKAPIHQPPALDPSGALYTVSADDHLVSLDAKTGQFHWEYQRDPPDSFTIRGEARPLPVGDVVYGGFHDGYLVALSASSGGVQWARPLGGDKKEFIDANCSPQMVDGVLYTGSYGVGLYALDPSDGGVRWRYDVEGVTTPAIDSDEGRIYLAAADSGLIVLDLAGHLIYQQATPGAGDPSEPTLWGPYVALSTARGGLYLARRSDGMLLQYFSPGSGFSSAASAAAGGHRLFALSNLGFLYAFDQMM
jgi:outer membrane protein assembly factor BamB